VNARPVALAALLAVAALPTASHAAPRPKPKVCNLVVDPAGDSAPVASDAVDIVGGDIASDSRKLTAVIRLKKWADTEPTAPLGRVYQINLTGQGGETYAFMSYFTTPAGASFKYGYHDATTNVDTGTGTATGKVDPAKNEIRMTVPVGSLSQMGTGSFKSGARITGIEITVGRWLGAYASADVYGGFTSPADSAAAEKSYTGGSLSCVKVGS
jgi:hypothetical protein